MDSSRPVDLEDFPVLIQLPVQWGDQDAFGHVNNTVPLRWFESSRIVYLEQCGLGEMMSGRGLGPIVASVTCHYRRQITYPDTLSVGTRVARIGRTSLVLGHAAFSHQQQKRACDGETVVVFFDYDANRPRRVPDEAREKLLSLKHRSA
ncbi:MAG: acyl-CoA thioesterase [Planctomycetes bacterium]|nr:acyl-CoA thioesterase [Planctomycetota bacterium]